MPTPEKFCLRWNDFQKNINTAFADLRKDTDFSDVTLVCQDGYQVESHKVVLAASSPFFHNLLKKNKHSHPLIYMSRIKAEDLLAIVDFLYYGETNIYQENLDIFLNIAEKLELKGLNSKKGEHRKLEGDDTIPQRQINQPTVPSTPTHKIDVTLETKIASQKSSCSEDQISSSRSVALPKQEFTGDMRELDEQIETMMDQGENLIKHGSKGMIRAFACKVCGKEGQKCNIKDHIEANHLEGINIPCSFCEKSFRSRDSLRHHMRTHN